MVILAQDSKAQLGKHQTGSTPEVARKVLSISSAGLAGPTLQV